eukprot:954552-Amorphochlora_amoeboformis.AAC.2
MKAIMYQDEEVGKMAAIVPILMCNLVVLKSLERNWLKRLARSQRSTSNTPSMPHTCKFLVDMSNRSIVCIIMTAYGCQETTDNPRRITCSNI